MNSTFVISQARRLAREGSMADSASEPDKIRHLYRKVLARDPGVEEIGEAQAFLASPLDSRSPLPNQSEGKLNRLEQLAQVLLMSNELMFVE